MQLLGGLSARRFLSQIWQTKPLLVRDAIPGFKGVVQAPELFALAARSDVESRLIWRRGGAWRLRRGPFSRTELARLPKSGWTLLVQGLNLELPAADQLLRRFSFLPYARLDDLMVSYAAPGGGVGPHFDSYDVFLLQGPGLRRWSVGRTRNRTLDPSAPLRILRSFRPQTEWVLAPGDMLYLPPGWAHEGVALEPGFTYSVGFRAPSHCESAREFLSYLENRIAVRGRYSDRGSAPQRNPAEIPGQMIRQTREAFRRIRWTAKDVPRFLGEYLSTPKPHVVFSGPRRNRSPDRFAVRCRVRGVRLDLRTNMLFRGLDFFVNGERIASPPRLRAALSRLADERRLEAGPGLSRPLLRLLHPWYLSGWLHIGDPGG
ncbi:MAG: cupin domain-containing protein [Burkholderiales bacterium]